MSGGEGSQQDGVRSTNLGLCQGGLIQDSDCELKCACSQCLRDHLDRSVHCGLAADDQADYGALGVLCACAALDVPFPLTLALSPGERERVRQRFCTAEATLID